MKVLYIPQHLSCGGMPQFLLKRIQSLMDYVNGIEIYVIEYNDYGKHFPTQRDQIKQLLGDRFYSLSDDKMEVVDIINEINPDIIHLDEMPELMNNDELFKKIYKNNRSWKIIETCHNSTFNPDKDKRYHPDLYAFCTPWHEDVFNGMNAKYITIPYPIDEVKYSSTDKFRAKAELGFEANKKHVINVGIWTKGKNQAEGIEIARKCPDMMFHFIGAQAGNFRDYWEPLMKSLPDNVRVWGERSDVYRFMMAADIFMFNSTLELNPLVLREAIGYGLPIIGRKLPQYAGMYDKYLLSINFDLNDIHSGQHYNIPKDCSSSIFALRHEEAYKKVIENPSVKQNIQIITNYIDNPFLEIRGIDDDKDIDNSSISIVLAHPNTELRSDLLKNCLNSLNTPIILSANYPVEKDAQLLCDYVIYTKDNPLLFKKDFEKYKVSYYHWHIDQNGEKKYTLFEKEHGYSVYCLIKNGVEYAKKLGYKKVNVINYDYEISKYTIRDNVKELETNDFVTYKYGSDIYNTGSYCSAFFSAKIDAILSFTEEYKNKKEYYMIGPDFNILENKLYDFIHKNNFKVKEYSIEDLKKNNKVDVEGIDYTNHAEKNRVIDNKRFLVEYYDGDKCIYSNRIDLNNWVKLNRQYFTKWIVKVFDRNELIYEESLNLNDRRVYVAFESKSLGDTLAWIPYVYEFQKIHNCTLIVSTFWNRLFDEAPNVSFVAPGTPVPNLYALYRLGYFYDLNKLPFKPMTIPLQKVATSILGLEYKEIQPNLAYITTRPTFNKYVTIATNSTAGMKFWDKKQWQETINWLVDEGYEVYNVSAELNSFDNCIQITTPSLESKMDWIAHSEFFIGLGSGLSWVAWALNKKVFMIANFSEDWAEFKHNCIKIENKSVCNGCWNNPNFKFDGSWEYCPVHKGSDRQWECQLSITSDMVINEIKKAGF